MFSYPEADKTLADARFSYQKHYSSFDYVYVSRKKMTRQEIEIKTLSAKKVVRPKPFSAKNMVRPWPDRPYRRRRPCMEIL